MAEEENVVTYETFRKFQKMERDNENLQELPDDFFDSCSDWINRKDKIYQESRDMMVLKEIENVISIIKDILDRRERKIFLMAMHVARTDTVPKNLHRMEIKYFDSIVENLKTMRKNILEKIMNNGEGEPDDEVCELVEDDGTEPMIEEKKEEKTEEEQEEEVEPEEEPEEETEQEEEQEEEVEPEESEEEPEEEVEPEEPEEEQESAKTEEPEEEEEEEPKEEEPDESEEEDPKKEEINEPGEEEQQEEPSEEEQPKIVEPEGYRMVRILEELPKFMGTDGKNYGPFKEDDLVTLEEGVAKILVEKRKAEFVQA